MTYRAWIPSSASSTAPYINYGKFKTGHNTISPTIGNMIGRTLYVRDRPFYIYKQVDKYIMYLCNVRQATRFKVNRRQHSGYSITTTDIWFGVPNTGDGLIYKYESEDGVNWTLLGTGKVYDNGNEVKYEEWYDTFLAKTAPIPVFIASQPVLTYEEEGE
jgi:hypothetical protein